MAEMEATAHGVCLQRASGRKLPITGRFGRFVQVRTIETRIFLQRIEPRRWFAGIQGRGSCVLLPRVHLRMSPASRTNPLAPRESPTPLEGNSTAPTDATLLLLIHRVSSAGRALRRLLADQATAIGLSDAELLVVWLCAPRGMIQGDLAIAIGVSPALMSGTVERLRQQGLIEMHRVPVDRRRQVWRTTEQGQHLLDALRPALFSLAEQIERRLPPAELALARELCERLSAIAHDVADQSPVVVPEKGRVAA
jgi:DNA-binding MarR family transcriptional regulator